MNFFFNPKEKKRQRRQEQKHKKWRRICRRCTGTIGEDALIDNAFITQGAIINGKVSHSVIFSDVEVRENAVVNQSVIMNDAVIGKGAKLTRCLVADDVRIPDGMVLGKKDSAEVLLVSKALIAKAGEQHE